MNRGASSLATGDAHAIGELMPGDGGGGGGDGRGGDGRGGDGGGGGGGDGGDGDVGMDCCNGGTQLSQKRVTGLLCWASS